MLDIPQFQEIEALEQLRNSNVLVFAVNKLDMSVLPTLYDALQSIAPCQQLDVVLYGNGGEINAARRVALLLRNFCDELNFIVPHHCQSAFTLLALAGQEVIAGELAMFSPIDPGLYSTGSAPDTADSLSSEDIRRFPQMAEQWFGVTDSSDKQKLLASLMESIFPPNLTTLFRSTQEQMLIAEELLSFHLPKNSQIPRMEIVEQLMFGYHSHHYSLTGENLSQMGININRESETESQAWQIAQKLSSVLGSRALKSVEDPLKDVLIATRSDTWVRKKIAHVPAPSWEQRSEHNAETHSHSNTEESPC